MKKLKIIALAVAVALIFSGCSMFSVNEERIQSQAVATVNGIAITRRQVEAEAEQSQEYQYYFYNYGFAKKDLAENKDLKEWYEDLLSRTLDQMVVNELLVQKAPGFGIELTAEEKQEQRKTADDQFSSAKEQIRAMVEEELAPGASISASALPEVSVSQSTSASPEVSPSPAATADPAAVDAEVEKRYQEMLKEAPFNPDTYYDFLCKQQLITKVTDYIHGQAEVTDDDVNTWYNDSVKAQQTEMDADPTVFATNMNDNQICVYVPEDTVAVKQVLVTYKDQDLAEVAKELYSAGKKDEAMKMLQGQIDTLMPAMRDIQQRIKNGESIDTLIAELGEDPGMTSGTAATLGYLVGQSTTTYLSEFKDAAVKLTAVGSVSDPVATYYGLHVMQAIKIYKKGVVPFDQLKDTIKAALLPTKQQQKYDELVEQWKKESKITNDKGRLYN